MPATDVVDRDPESEEPIPEELFATQGLTEDEAVAIALWNNAALRETLGQLGVSRAQLFAAGLMTDPQFIMLLPIGTKQLEMTLLPAIDALWLRPIRIRAAKLDLNRVAQQMVQNGIDVARDVRLAHADLVQARERSALAEDAVQLRREIAELAEKRLEAGDISELEALTTRIDRKQAETDAERFAEDVVIARDRLAALLGFAVDEADLDAPVAAEPVLVNRRVDELVGEALAVRPDLRAAEFAVETTRGQLDVAKFPFTELDFGWDANTDGEEGFESGPALRMRIPIFNGNRGNKAIANAQLKQAIDGTRTVHDRIVLEVRNAHSRAVQARRNLDALRERIIPTLREAETLARRNYVDGGASYFLVLQTSGQYLDARAREIQLEGDLRRAIAELDRSVGHRVVDRPTEPPGDAVESDVLPAPNLGDRMGAIDGVRPRAGTPVVIEADESRIEPVSAAMPSGDANATRTRLGQRVEQTAGRASRWTLSKWLPQAKTDVPLDGGSGEGLADPPNDLVPSDHESPVGERAWWNARTPPQSGRDAAVHYPVRRDRR